MTRVTSKHTKKIACLLTFTMLTTSGCSLSNFQMKEIPKKSYVEKNYIESVDEESKIESGFTLVYDDEVTTSDVKEIELSSVPASDISLNPSTAETIDNEQDTNLRPSTTETIDDESSISTVIKSPVEQFLEELISTDYGYSSSLKDFYNEHWDIIEDLTLEDNENIRLYYAKLTYQKLLSYDIPYENMITELNNLMVEQQLPRCMSDEDWNNNFGCLISTLEDDESLASTYTTLAYFIHKCNCLDEHSIDLGISCKTLKKEFENKYK